MTDKRANKLHKMHNREAFTAYIFISPFLGSFLLFFLVPAVYSIVLSFYRYRGFGNATFVGLRNYVTLIQYPFFWTAFANTFFYLVVHIIPTMVISFSVAVMLHSSYSKWTRLLKMIIFSPQVLAVVSAAMIWRVIFATRSGVINTLLGTEIPFLQDKLLMKLSVVIMITWRGIGWFMVIFLSGLTTISKDIMEASIIDGANVIQRLFRITIPMMKSIFALSFIIETIASIKMAVEPNLLISNWLDAPVDAMPILNIVINNIKGGNFGFASAAGWIIFIVIFLLSIVQLRLFNES